MTDRQYFAAHAPRTPDWFVATGLVEFPEAPKSSVDSTARHIVSHYSSSGTRQALTERCCDMLRQLIDASHPESELLGEWIKYMKLRDEISYKRKLQIQAKWAWAWADAMLEEE